MSFDQHYAPIIKTTDAELRGYEHVTDQVRRRSLPIFELTKSRRTKKVPHGDIHRRMSRIRQVTRGYPFVLDVTTHSDLINPQIEQLLDDTSAYRHWQNFLAEYDDLPICPVVHAYSGGEDLTATTALADALERRFGRVAFRAGYSDSELPHYLRAIMEGLNSADSLFLVIDCEYVAPDDDLSRFARQVQQRVAEVSEAAGGCTISVSASGFPKSAVAEGQDHAGAFPMREVELFRLVTGGLRYPVIYGDYCSIHPYRYDVRGGTWVPRVDVPLDEQYLYTRYRRENGGYERAARAMFNWEHYEPIGSWGDEQIQAAADGHPNGFSPVFWIAVRLNIHATRKAVTSPVGVGDTNRLSTAEMSS